MPRTLSALTTTLVDAPNVDIIRLCKIEFDGLTLYLCERRFGDEPNRYVFDSQIYEPIINSISSIGTGKINPHTIENTPGEANIVIDNSVGVGGATCFSSLFESYAPHYATVTISIIFSGGSASGDAEVLFRGTIEDIPQITPLRCQLMLSSYELDIVNKFPISYVNTDEHPDADPYDIGKMFPVVYGDCSRVPFRSVNILGSSTLTADITDAQSTIEVTDTSRFLAPLAYLWIDDENIRYTGISGNTFTGCLRGLGSTSAAEHSQGTRVYNESFIQNDEYFYAINHAVHSIDNVYVEGVRQTANFTAYTGQAGDQHASYGAMAVIVFVNDPYIRQPPPITEVLVSADVQGYRDTTGDYGGSGNLISRPDWVIKHILIAQCGLTASDIDTTTYTSSGTSYGTESYESSVVLLQKPNVRSLINRIAFQAKSIEHWSAGKHHLQYIPDSESADISIESSRVDLNQVYTRFTDRTYIQNKFTGRYEYYWSGYISDETAYRGSVAATDSTSITAYGTIERDVLSFQYINTEAQAQDVMDWRSGDLKGPRLIIEMAVSWGLLAIKKGDIIDFTGMDSYLQQALSQLVSGSDLFRVISLNYGSESIRLTLVSIDNWLPPQVLRSGSGTYTMTGTNASLLHDKVLTSGSGTYTVTGTDIAFQRYFLSNDKWTVITDSAWMPIAEWDDPDWQAGRFNDIFGIGDSAAVALYPVGGWESPHFRPEKIRITHDAGVDLKLFIEDTDSPHNVICSDTSVGSGDELTITFIANNIYSLWIYQDYSTVTDFNVSNIEFYDADTWVSYQGS